jgi:hypothetical protein
VSNEPDDEIITEDDMTNYEDIMVTTNAMRRETDPSRPKASGSYKYMNYIKPIWEKHKPPKEGKTGKGLKSEVVGRAAAPPGRLKGANIASGGERSDRASNTIIVASDPNALFSRLEQLLASKDAGNTGHINELVAICDELKRLGQLTDGEYKDLNVLINND